MLISFSVIYTYSLSWTWITKKCPSIYLQPKEKKHLPGNHRKFPSLLKSSNYSCLYISGYNVNMNCSQLILHTSKLKLNGQNGKNYCLKNSGLDDSTSACSSCHYNKPFESVLVCIGPLYVSVSMFPSFRLKRCYM